MDKYDKDNDLQAYKPDNANRAKMRSESHIRTKAYGFYPVVTEATPLQKCGGCGVDVTHKRSVIIDGENYCIFCLHQRVISA